MPSQLLVYFNLYELIKIKPEPFFVRRAFGPVRPNPYDRNFFILVFLNN
jgi:hypothetical protein